MVKKLPGARLKSKTAQRDGIELTLELRLREDETGFVEKFLREHEDFTLSDDGYLPGGMRTFLPHRDGCDGFFGAKMIRKIIG